MQILIYQVPNYQGFNSAIIMFVQQNLSRPDPNIMPSYRGFTVPNIKVAIQFHLYFFLGNTIQEKKETSIYWRSNVKGISLTTTRFQIPGGNAARHKRRFGRP